MIWPDPFTSNCLTTLNASTMMRRRGDAAGYVQEVLRREMELAAIRQRLREGIDRGLDDLEAGRFVTLDAPPALRADIFA